MLSSRSNAPWFTPRPMIVSMLNNKAAIYMERHQYEEARKSLNRALRLAEKESNDDNTKDATDTTLPHSCIRSKVESNQRIEIRSDKEDRIAFVHNMSKELSDIDMTSRTASSEDTILSTSTKGEDEEAKDVDRWSNFEKYCISFESSTDDVGNKDTNSSCIHKRKKFNRQGNPPKTEYDEGMDYFKSPFRLVYDSPRSLNGTVLFNLARVSLDQGNLDDSLILYKRSLLAIKKSGLRDEALTMAVLGGIGKIQYVKGDLVASLNTFMTALALAQSHYGETSLEVAACLNCIGVLHYMMPNGDDEIALDALKASLQQRRTLLGKNHIDVGTTNNNIGRMYFQLGKYDRAMEAYCEALRIRRRCQGESVDVAATLFNCGQVYHNLEKRDKALSYFQEFLKLAKVHFGEFHRDICIVTTCIGQIYHEEKHYAKALKSFQHALRIGHIALGPVHSEIAMTLNKMGNVFYETGDLDAALKSYHQGLKIEIAVLEPGNPNTFVTYTNIAEIHKQREEYRKALKYYDKVYEMQTRHGAEMVEIANTLGNIGYTKQQMDDLDGALEANQECLRLRREVFGDTHEDVASTLTHTGLVLLKLERHDIALQVFIEAYRIRKSLPNCDSSNLAFTIYNIALIYHHLGSHDEALRFYTATADIEREGLGIAHRDLSITYYNIGQIYYQRGEMERALDKFNEALEIEIDCYGEYHPTCARTLNEIGNIEMQLGNLERMMECYVKALRIYKEAGMVDENVAIYGLQLWRFDRVHPEAAAVA